MSGNLQKFFKLNTIDLDKVGRQELEDIYRKISLCPFHGTVDFRDTQKGYHLLMKCSKECDICRFVFDDQKRFAADFKRPEYKKNVLFEPFSAHRCIK